MRAVVQRVRHATVRVADKVVARIGPGLLVFVGIGKGDTPEVGEALAEKILSLRVFDDEQGRMNLSLREAAGDILVVSEFTVYGDCRKGRRPNYVMAAPPEAARALYEAFVESVKSRAPRVATGEFHARMEVELVNEGPVTLLLDSDRTF